MVHPDNRRAQKPVHLTAKIKGVMQERLPFTRRASASTAVAPCESDCLASRQDPASALGLPVATHDRIAVVMDHQPLITDPFKASTWFPPAGRPALLVRCSVQITHPQIARHLYLHVGWFEFHGEGIVEDQPQESRGRPVAPEEVQPG